MSITFKNSVLKIDDDLAALGRKTIAEQGLPAFLMKSILFAKDIVWRFLREYIPLQIFLAFADGNGEIRQKIQGNSMLLNLDDEGISRELALYGVHERNSTEEVKRLVKKGMKILEVGANIGYYAILETKLAGADGHLYAFEPSPFNFDLLKRNLSLNKIGNADIYQKAAGAENTAGKFFVANKSNLSSFIQRDSMDMIHDGKIVDVDIVRLDDFFAEKDLDFIRMDVEGYELEILKGAEKLLERKNPPKHFFIEVHSELLHKKDSSAKEIVENLRRHGYEVIKSYYRGSSKIQVADTEALLSHPLLEKGYWETFFEHKKKN